MTDIRYNLIRSDRKTICITVKKDMSIEVRAPLRMKQDDIDRFVSEKHCWIAKAMEKYNSIQTTEFNYGSKIYFLGNEYIVTETQENRISLQDDCLLVPPLLTQQELKDAVIRFYKSRAKEYLPERVKKLSLKTDLEYASLLINSARTHWGSCTKDRLHISCLLMAAEPEVIDYVIIHELAHTVHHNHSKSFWALVKKHCPDYNRSRNLLKALAYSTAIFNN